MRMAVLTLLLFLAADACRPASAEVLGPEACQALEAEQKQLIGFGVRADMQKGPEWGRVNLAAERLKQVARLIEIDEQILFRCPRPQPPPQVAAPAQPKAKGKAAKRQAKQPASETAGEEAAATPAKTPRKAQKKKAPASAAAAPAAPIGEAQ